MDKHQVIRIIVGHLRGARREAAINVLLQHPERIHAVLRKRMARARNKRWSKPEKDFEAINTPVAIDAWASRQDSCKILG